MISSMFSEGPRIARRDVAIAVLFAAVGVPFIGWGQDKAHSGSAASNLLMGLLILLAVVPVLWRRRAPLVAAAGTLAGTAIHVAAYGTIGRCGLLLPLFFVEAFAVAAWLDRREALVGLAIVLGAGVVCLSADSSAGWSGLDDLGAGDPRGLGDRTSSPVARRAGESSAGAERRAARSAGGQRAS